MTVTLVQVIRLLHPRHQRATVVLGSARKINGKRNLNGLEVLHLRHHHLHHHHLLEKKRKRKTTKRKKKKKKKSKKKKNKSLKKKKSAQKEELKVKKLNKKPSDASGSAPVPRVMKPMTKEEWEKQQSVVRRVLDPETGRTRLVKGDGEILEEIVSRERHQEINKQATQGDGLFFQRKLGITDR